MEPTNSDELKSLLLELTCSRTEIAFKLHDQESIILAAFCPSDCLLIHVETGLDSERQVKIWQTLKDLPGMGMVNLVISAPGEEIKFEGITVENLRLFLWVDTKKCSLEQVLAWDECLKAILDGYLVMDTGITVSEQRKTEKILESLGVSSLWEALQKVGFPLDKDKP